MRRLLRDQHPFPHLLHTLRARTVIAAMLQGGPLALYAFLGGLALAALAIFWSKRK